MIQLVGSVVQLVQWDHRYNWINDSVGWFSRSVGSVGSFSSVGAMVQLVQWFSGTTGTTGSMAQLVQWFTRIIGTNRPMALLM